MNEYELALCFDANIPQHSIVGEFYNKQDPDFKCFIGWARGGIITEATVNQI